MQCKDADLRLLEWQLRKWIYHDAHFQDDYVIEPMVRFDIPGEYTGYTYGDGKQRYAWGIPIIGADISKQAYHMQDYLSEPGNLEKLLAHEVDFLVDWPRYQTLSNLYQQALDGIIEVEFTLPYVVLVQSLLIELVHLRGLSELMYDLYDNTEMLHAVMDHMSVSKAALLDRLEQEHRLFDNRSNIYTGSGGLGYTMDRGAPSQKIMLKDMWGFADSQEFSDVSPEMFEEFALQYQKRGLSKFGRACYGCCEPLDNKFDRIFAALPNVRRLSVSPWSNIEIAAENIGTRAVYSWKPNPAKICMGVDEEEVSALLQRLKKATSGQCYAEIILKDVRTCGGTPKHMQRFVEMVHKKLC
ncbi:MAG: hypothetical protein RR900_08610, partial [Ruthenibacterium sp.]